MELIDLRYSLAIERIRGITGENAVSPAFIPYFEKGAEWFLIMDDEMRFLSSKEAGSASIDALQKRNRRLYEEILPENYGCSYANPEYAARTLGNKKGPLMAALRYEMRSAIPYAYRLERERVLIRAELFLEIYTAFTIAFKESGGSPKTSQIKSIIRQYLMDYIEEEMLYSVSDRLTVTDDRVKRLVFKGSDAVSDGDNGVIPDAGFGTERTIRDLYLSGEYVTSNETETASFIGALPEEKITLIADTITEGFIRGFIVCGKNLASKKNAAFLFHLGFERIYRKCVANLEKQGLAVIVPAEIPTLFFDYTHGEEGYSGADPNPQYYYDHKEDLALFLDENLNSRFIEGLEKAYRKLREKTVYYAGPIVIETFGEKPFSPAVCPHAPRYSVKQEKMCAQYRIRTEAAYSEAVAAKDRSFTLIDFPLPRIADTKEAFGEIFDAFLKINTLDYALYEKIQTKMTDALGTASRVEIKGRGANRTDLTVNLYRPVDPSTEANFENCLADVNFPVGEVFTTPVLEGTEGILHVSGVYLEGLYYKDLEITFREGRVSGYRCANFEDEREGRRYIEENILFHHKDLPMGELAIGTNTAAYAAAAKYGIADRLPILIAEKTGPHFAVGDTCYARDEENRMFNPDGKEVAAKENSVTALRKTEPEKAYFGCHTDITIPYEELAEFTAVTESGERIPILLNGRFVLEGTEFLNIPLDQMEENPAENG